MTRSWHLTLALPVLLATSGCSQQEAASEADNRSDMSTTPDVALTAAPGVAFRYVYRFGLEATKVAALQERHASACEALGANKCRITGMSFNRNGDKEVSGALNVALAPDIARKFGKDAMTAVESESGVVSSIEIEGVDRATEIADSEKQVAAAQAERAEFEKSAANGALTPGAQRDLLERLAEQRSAERDAVRRGEAAQRSLAMTPMHFAYSTEGFLPGISLDRTAWSALGIAAMLLNALFALMVVLAALAIPAGLIMLGFAHGRKQVLRLWRWLAPNEPDLA